MPCDFNKRMNSLIKELKDNNVSKEDIAIATERLREFDKARRTVNTLSDAVVVSNDTPNERYELFDGVYSNKEQTSFINKFKDWYSEDFDHKNDSNNVFVLSGRGGTGKSSSVQAVINETIGKKHNHADVLYATPTNKASKVLKDSLSEDETVYTIAQLLSMVLKKQADGSLKLVKSLTYNKKTGQMEEVPTKIEEMSSPKTLLDTFSDLIVIDEASMLSTDTMNSIIEEAKKYKFKILFMGDNVQLPPVDKDSIDTSDESPVFLYPTKFRSELKERMRQGEESPILQVTDLFANQIESNDYSTKIENKNYDDSLEFINSTPKAIENFSKDFKDNPLHTRYIIFNNASNKKYKTLEKKLKDSIYGTGRSQYSNHEQIYFSSPAMNMQGLSGEFENKSSKGKPIEIFSPSTGDEYTIINNNIKRVVVKTTTNMWTETSSGKSINIDIPLSFSVNTVDVIANEFINNDMSINYNAIKEKYDELYEYDKSEVFYHMPVSNKRDIEIDTIDYDSIRKVGGSRGTSVTDVDIGSLTTSIIKEINKDLPLTNSAMLINSHQAQGSTYDTVYTDISNTTNLIKNNFLSYKLGTKAMYVATSRPRNKLVLVNSQDITTKAEEDKVIESKVVPDTKGSFIKRESVIKEGNGYKKIDDKLAGTVYEKEFIDSDAKLFNIPLAIRYIPSTRTWSIMKRSTNLVFESGTHFNRNDAYRAFKAVVANKTRIDILNALKNGKSLEDTPITLTTDSKASEVKAYANSIGFTPLSGIFGSYEKEYLRLFQKENNKSTRDNTWLLSHIGKFLETGKELPKELRVNENSSIDEDILKLYHKVKAKESSVMGSEIGTEFKDSQKLDESDFNVSEDLENTIDKLLTHESLLKDNEYTDEYREDTKRIASKITSMFKEVLPDYSFKFTKYRPINNEETKGAFSSTLGYLNEDRVQLIANPNSRLTTESEVMLHETVHATLKHIFSNDPKLRNRVKIIRDNFRKALQSKFDTDKAMITFVSSNMIKDDVSDMYLEMEKRFNYVFSEESNVEEFMTYMLTNPSMREAGKMFNADDTPVEDSNISKTFWGKLRRMFSEFLKKFNKESSVKDIKVTQSVENIFDTMLAARRDYELRNSQSLEDLVSGYVPIPVFNTVARFGAVGYTKFIDNVEMALNSKLSKTTKALILREFNKIKYSLKNNKSFKRMMNAQKSSATISKILKSEVVSSIWNQYFNSNVYSPDKSVRDLMRSFERIDSESRNMRASIFKIIENKLLDGIDKDSEGKYKLTLEKKAKVIKDLILGSGLNKVFASLVPTDLDRDSVNADLQFLKDDIETFAKDSIDNLDSLALYGRNRQSNEQFQVINIRGAVGSELFFKLNDSQRDILNRYVITKGLSLMTDTELNSIKSIVGNQDVIHMLKIINSTKAEYDSVVSRDGYNEPFYYSLNPMSSTPRTIRVGTLKEAKAIGSRLVSTEPVFTVDNVKYYKYTTVNYSPSLDSGAISTLSTDIDGYPVSSILKKHFSKIDLDARNKQNVNSKIYDMNTQLLKNNIKVKSLIPKYNSAGMVVDYIIPFDKSDVYVLQDTKNSSVEFLSNLAFHYKDRANRVTQKDKVLIELLKHKVSKEDYNKNKENYIPLSDIKGLSLDDEFYIAFKDIKVPRYLALYLTGAKRPSLSNMKLTLGKHELFDMSEHPSIKNIVGTSEKFLEEVFSEFKQQLTLFNTGIAIGNFSSNMYSAMSDGIDPVTFSKEFKKNSEMLYEFERMIIDFEDMRTKVRAGILDSTDSNYNLLFANIKNNKFFPLYKQGHITPTVDDGDILHDTTILSKVTNKFARNSNINKEIQLEAEKLSYKNGKSVEDNLLTAKRNIRNKIKVAIPDIIADIKGNLYGSDEASTKKVAEKVLIYGDVVAKMIMLEHRAKKNDGNFNLDNEIRELGELFVNYSHPSSGFEQYIEKVTGFLFLKYLFRSLKGYYTLAVKNPLRIGLMTATGAFTGINVSSPDDANFKNGTIDALTNRAKGDDLDEVLTSILSWRVEDILSGGLNSVYTTK